MINIWLYKTLIFKSITSVC